MPFLQLIVLVDHRGQAENLDQVDHQERADLLNQAVTVDRHDLHDKSDGASEAI